MLPPRPQGLGFRTVNWMNIIVRMPNWIGDLVMATPVLADVRKNFPQASITAMCRRPICALLEKDGAIDELFCFSKPVSGFVRREEERDIVETLKEGKFDVGILLTNSFSSAWWFWQGGVKRRIGFSGHGRSLLLTDRPKRGQGHQVEVYKRVLEPLGIGVSETAPRLFVSEQEMGEARELLRQRGYTGGKLVGINPGAAYGSAKCWPEERFREVALRLIGEGMTVVFFGDGATAELVKRIYIGLPNGAINLAGATNLRELMCLIRLCDVLVTNDSGPMHIGAAFGVPLVALFGSTDDLVTGPYGQAEAVIHKRPSCSPCFKRVCPIDFRCMKGIGVEEVVERVKRYV